jgi:glutamate dehydrogenase (NAD(P)+)
MRGSNIQKLFWIEDDISKQLHRIMARAFHEVHEIALKEKVNMLTAAYMLAVSRMAAAKRIRGIFP